MKLIDSFLAGLVSIGLLAIFSDSALAGGREGGHYFSVGNPGGIQTGPVYPLRPTPANQAWVNNNAWANYLAQLRQGANVSSGTSGPALQQNGRR